MNSPTPTLAGRRPNFGLDHSSPSETAPADELARRTQTEAPPLSEHGSGEGFTRFDACNRWGCPSGYAYVFPLDGPRQINRRRTR